MSDFAKIQVNLTGAEIKFCADLFDTLAEQIYRENDRGDSYHRRVLADQLREAVDGRCRFIVIDLTQDDLWELISALRDLADYLANEGPTPELKKLAGLLAHRDPGDLQARADRLEALLKNFEAAQ